MKVNITRTRKVSITNLTIDQYNAMVAVLTQANNAFDNEPDSDGGYYSDNDFVCVLYQEEREGLTELVDSLPVQFY